MLIITEFYMKFLSLLILPVFALEVICHRGAHLKNPENTFAAFKKCYELGAQFLELDIRTSDDGILYVFHDKRLERTTNGRGFFRNKTSRYLDSLDAGKGEKIPKLEDVLKWGHDKIKFYFDIKDAKISEVAELVKKYNIKGSMFWHVNPFKIPTLAETFPGSLIKSNIYGPISLKFATDFLGANTVEVSLDYLNKKLINLARAKGLKIMAYSDSLNPKILKRAYENSIDFVNTDYPGYYEHSKDDLVHHP